MITELQAGQGGYVYSGTVLLFLKGDTKWSPHGKNAEAIRKSINWRNQERVEFDEK
jgi:hypothetical protein